MSSNTKKNFIFIQKKGIPGRLHLRTYFKIISRVFFHQKLNLVAPLNFGDVLFPREG